MFLATAWSVTAYLEHRKIIVEEVEAIAEHSDALFASNRKLLALMEAIKAKKKLQSYQVKSEKLKILIDRVLNQAIYGAIEYNCFLGHQGEVFGVASSQDRIKSGVEKKEKTFNFIRSLLFTDIKMELQQSYLVQRTDCLLQLV